jgi:tetratricopeptide (TPR) repeat protein
VRLLLLIARALAYAHQQGIVHRDIKPSNVLLSEGDWPLLTDYGLAKMVESTSQLTGSGVGMGTPMYMSPEQGQGVALDHRTDIYSLGIMFYEMLTGDVPFQADTPMAIVIKHISSPMPMPRQVNSDIPEVLERIILKATAKSPLDRYQTAEELVVALEHSLTVLGSNFEDEPGREEISLQEAAKPTVQKDRVHPPELDQELEKRLEQNYVDGLSAYWIKNWDKAQANFRAVIAARPDYKDAADLLAEVENHLELETLYQQAQTAMDNEDWPAARSALEELVAVDSDYEQAAEMLEGVNSKLRLSELYEQARQLHQAGKWRAVISVFERIEAIEPGFDPDGLLSEAEHSLADQELETKLDGLYRQALDEMNAGHWETARTSLEQIQGEQPGFRETEQLLERVAAEVAEGEPPTEHKRIPWLRKVPSWGWVLGGLAVLILLVGIVGSSTGLLWKMASTDTEVGLQESSTLSGREYYDQGVSLIDQEDYQGAIDAFEKALDLGWESSELYTKLGFALTLDRQTNEAIIAYTKAIELDPNVVENWVERGWRYFESGNNETALQDFEKAIELDPENPSPYEGMASAYRGLGNPDTALQILTEAIERFPDNAGLYNVRGWLYFEDFEEYDLAISDFSMAIEVHPDSPHNHYFRGYVYQWLGRDDEARVDFETVMEIAGGDPSFEHHSFVAHWLAENEAGRITDPEQQDHRYWREHGWTYFGQNNYEIAKEAFDRAIELNPEDFPAWWGRALVYRGLGDPQAAIQNFDRAIELNPHVGLLFIDRGLLYFEDLGDIDQALSDFNRAIEANPHEPNVYFERGGAYQQLGMVDEARADFETYLEMTGGDPSAFWHDTIMEWLAENPRVVPGCVEPPPGLVSWWTGDGHTRDVIGGNHAELMNGAGFADGIVEEAFAFPPPRLNGEDAVVEVFEAPRMDGLEELTIETWVMLASGPAFRIERFVTIGVEGTDVPKAVLRIDGGPGFRGNLHFYMGIDNELQHIWVEDVPDAGHFHHVAGSYDGSVMRLYLDGREVGSFEILGEVASGASFVGMGSPGEPLDGLLDEVSIYDRALANEEIQAIFEAGNAGKCKP